MGGKGSGGHNRKDDEIKRKLGTYQPCRQKAGRNEDSFQETGNPKTPRAPSTLGKHGQGLWRRVVSHWLLDPGELFVLERACEAMDQLMEAEEVLARTGITIIDGKGVEVPHPCCQLRKEARVSLLRFWDKLNLDHSPLED